MIIDMVLKWTMSDSIYFGEEDSIDRTLFNCQFVKTFVNNMADWFNAVHRLHKSTFGPTIEEKLFGIISGPYGKEIVKKFNYTILLFYGVLYIH